MNRRVIFGADGRVRAGGEHHPPGQHQAGLAPHPHSRARGSTAGHPAPLEHPHSQSLGSARSPSTSLHWVQDPPPFHPYAAQVERECTSRCTPPGPAGGTSRSRRRAVSTSAALPRRAPASARPSAGRSARSRTGCHARRAARSARQVASPSFASFRASGSPKCSDRQAVAVIHRFGEHPAFRPLAP